jgi:two-component system sensor histidine kinase PilS (NtrC family)
MNEGITKRLRAFILLRTLVVTILLGSFYLFRDEYSNLFYPSFLSYLIALLYFIIILYSIIIRWIKNMSQYVLFIYIQIATDLISETLLVFLTGGIASLFSILFPLSIISASILLNRRACFIVAISSSILYGLLIDLQFYEVIPLTTDFIYTEKDFLYHIFANITAFLIIAFLSGHLSKTLQRTRESLKSKDSLLNDLQAFSRDMIESMPSGVLTTDLNRRIITFNSSAQKITKYSYDYAIGKKPEDIFPFLTDSKNQIERAEGEIHRNGKRIIVGIRFSPLNSSSGQPRGTIGIFQDLTELKAMEAEIRRSMKWASIGELSASIAHELRNPLASLKASVEMLREKKGSPDRTDHLMKIALSEMDRLNNIVTDFLLYAKPQKVKREKFDLNKSLKDIIILLRSAETDNKNVKITDDIHGHLSINGDSKQLTQVFWNLGLNAIQAVPENGTVNIQTEKYPDSVKIVFSDTGIGLSKDDIENIFNPFYTKKENGIGLGLSIAQRIIEEHGGNIKAESNGVGSGAAFTIELPLHNK